MNIILRFGCLVSLAVLIGLTESAECIGENCGDTCSCTYAVRPNVGCTLSLQNPAPAYNACQCTVQHTIHGPECMGIVVACADPNSPNCNNNNVDFERCMQGVSDGRGNCCGYELYHNPCKNVGGNTRLFGALGGAPHQPGFHPQGFHPGGFGQGFQPQGFPGQVGSFGHVGGLPGQIGVGVGPVGVGGVSIHGVGSAGSTSCRRWCRTPQGQAYCCEGANDPLTAAVTKPGQCPVVRSSCPPTRFHNPPAQCSSDGACSGHDKCCFDTCLQHHTCKPPIGLGK